MSTIKRITVFIFAVLIIAANLPLCASAVDPVSAATMANALAQAITAYGASQGVSMTFDVADTDGIGEGVHELWDQFVTDVNDPNTPTYDSLAVTVWSNLYSKIGNNLGINISATEMPFIDSFWNWILSGPAEMTKVDNQYYEWSVDSNTGNVLPILVQSSSDLIINNDVIPFTTNIIYGGNYGEYTVIEFSQAIPVYGGTRNNRVLVTALVIPSNISVNAVRKNYNSDGTISSTSNFTVTSRDTWGTIGYYPIVNLSSSSYNSNNNFPVFASGSDNDYNPYYVFGQYSSATIDSVNSSINIRPYIGDITPQNVYIPDNTDVNYNPTDVAIPLDIPWDNTLFGDGDGVLSDAQSEAAAATADDAIADSVEKTLTIADTENPDIPAAGEVYVPFLPVTLPNFNFNLSGIWHYVREWITSLGAWFATVLTVWASLPYAMVVPVYATLVIVIVLGVYKRFFM